MKLVRLQSDGVELWQSRKQSRLGLAELSRSQRKATSGTTPVSVDRNAGRKLSGVRKPTGASQ